MNSYLMLKCMLKAIEKYWPGHQEIVQVLMPPLLFVTEILCRARPERGVHTLSFLSVTVTTVTSGYEIRYMEDGRYGFPVSM